MPMCLREGPGPVTSAWAATWIYRQDRVTVYLRATSTSNGRILKTIYTSRTILSQKVDAGLFKFVSFQRLMEAETGFTHNEPSELAVREAIEKGVHALVVEGIQDGSWQLANEEERNSPGLQVRTGSGRERTD